MYVGAHARRAERKRPAGVFSVYGTGGKMFTKAGMSEPASRRVAGRGKEEFDKGGLGYFG